MPKGSQNIRKYVSSTTGNGLEKYKHLYITYLNNISIDFYQVNLQKLKFLQKTVLVGRTFS